MRRSVLVLAVAVVVLWGWVASAGLVTGLGTNGSYGLYDGLYQWEIGADAASSRQLGKVALGAGGLIGHELWPGTYTADVARLSDGRVAVAHRDATNTKAQVSVLTPTYDATGLLTGATLDATFDNVHSAGKIAPLPNGGFVTMGGGSAVFYQQTGPSTWTATTNTGPSGNAYDVAGLVNGNCVVGDYIDDPNKAGNIPRTGHKYDATSTLARYSGGANGYGWGYGKSGEGLRSALLSNGWILTGETSTTIGSAVCDGTETDGQWYDGRMGEVTNSDGTGIYDKQWAALSDGRVVTVWSSGWMRHDTTFRVYDLVNDPGDRVGTVGANGETFEAILGAGVGGDTFVGRIAGDYMVEPPARPVAEPAALSIVGLALCALRRRRS